MTGLDPALLEALDRRLAQRKLLRYRPYDWQREFHDAGADHPERMLRAANRVGKTLSAAAEVAMHLTGEYPDWWKGRRLAKAPLVWVAGVTNEATRDIVQKMLLGDPPDGTGLVLGDRLYGKPTYRQAGVSNVIDAFRVRHKSGGIAQCVLKTYEQGWRKFQGAEVDVVWLDEEPDDYKVYTECLTRIMTAKGILLVTFTPLLGETDLVVHFAQPKASGVYLKTATWDDAPHLEEAEKTRMRASLAPHELDARTKGMPSMGSGKVFPVDEDDITVDAIEIPAWFRRIVGIDFGIDHPFAAVWLAHDAERDTVYVTDAYRQANETTLYHAAAIKSRGDWIPVSWPHDGLQRDKGSGEPLRDQFLKHRVSMLSDFARYGDDRGNSVEPGLLDMWERMKTGRFKVFKHLRPWFEEFRSYHRKDGVVVKVRDDLMSATRTGMMMLRYAAPFQTLGRVRPPAYSRPVLTTRL